ncbi:MAG: hypothetical protein VYC39_17760, partial [Myxococcota bacterium]|nr:hypothetical protein [Myxococcota bacterium]
MRVGQVSSFLDVNPRLGYQSCLSECVAPTANPLVADPVRQLSEREIHILTQILLKFIQALMGQLNQQSPLNGFPYQMAQNRNFGRAQQNGVWPQSAGPMRKTQSSWTKQALGGGGLNQSDMNLLPSGTPRRTQRATQIPISQPHGRGLREASEDLPRIQNLSTTIGRIAKHYDIPPSILAGIVSRETRGRNVIGDNGHGHGLAQVDSGSFGPWARNWRASGMPLEEGLRKGAEIFANKREYLRNRFPQLTPNELMTATLSAYNAGEGAVGRALQRGASTDSVTTG